MIPSYYSQGASLTLWSLQLHSNVPPLISSSLTSLNTLRQTNIAWEIHRLKMYLLLNMVVFHCYVSLLEGILNKNPHPKILRKVAFFCTNVALFDAVLAVDFVNFWKRFGKPWGFTDPWFLMDLLLSSDLRKTRWKTVSVSAGWEFTPKRIVNSKGILPKMTETFRLRIYSKLQRYLRIC